MLYREATLIDEETLEYVLSDESIDRYGEQIMVDGWDLKAFKRNPIALLNHDKSQIIGGWEKVRIEGTKLIGRLKLAAPGTSALVDAVRALVKQRFLRAVSVGFRDIEREPLTKDSDPYFGPFRYLKSELVESSLVAVPANPNALQITKSFGLTDRERALILGKPATEDERDARTGSRQARQTPSPVGRVPMKLSERITAAQADMNRLRDTLTALVEKDDPTDEEQAQIDELNVRVEDANKALARMQATERALAIRVGEDQQSNLPAVRGAGNGGGGGEPHARPFAVAKKKLEPLDLLVRMFVCSFEQFVKNDNIDQIRQRRYGDDETTMWFIRAVQGPALTTVPGWAAELVQTAIGEFMNLLQPVSVFPTLRDRGNSFTFDRAGGIIRVPARTSTPTLAGAWVGEGQPIPVRRLGLTSVTLTPKKLGVISDFSQEIADYSTPNIEGVIRQAMAEDTAIVIDTNLLDDVAATAVRPAGLRAGIAGLTPSANTDPTAAMIEDLKALIAAIVTVNGGRSIVVIMNTLQEMSINFAQTPMGFLFPSAGEASRRFNVTFVASNTVPANTVIAIDAADFASAAGAAPEYNVSNQATVHEEDTAPLPIVATGGTAAAPVRSYWQTDTIGIRMRLPLNWAMRRPGMVSWMTGVTW